MAYWLIVFGIFGVLRIKAYENHTLVRLVPQNDDQFTHLRSFNDPAGDIEIMKRSFGLNDSLEVLVPPEKISLVENFANAKNISLQIKHKNYGRLLYENKSVAKCRRRRRALPRFGGSAYDVNRYHTFESKHQTLFEPFHEYKQILETDSDRIPKRRFLRNDVIFAYNSNAAIQDYIENIAKTYPHLVNLQTLGKSSQGRPMQLVRISANPAAKNPVIFVDAGIHAREWAAPAMAVYMIHRLVAGGGGAEELKGVDWYILPLVNPDGYEYTRASPSNRMWRKTMSKSLRSSSCFGVDGNRNYGFKWGVSGISTNPCDRETYAGPKPFSEPETQHVRNVMIDNKNRIKLYVSLHAYGQYLVYPWGYTGDRLPSQWKKLDQMARTVSNSVVKAGGKPFKVLSAGKWYAAAGGSDDFAFGGVGIPYSYTMELTDGYEFIFPEHLLSTTLPPLYEGFRSFAKQIRSEFGRRAD